ncbi:hypothetical protein Hypma_014569 [Hypsizygus marmoreus]|uniref:Uncharacterized protein n=1 Tax=Hypsizygus marmoreus TaxID=39966 RepID=A0A369JGR4_HYPMA|nr:hypothetical protein Hypma_014569 [Hypsizygus marmoreus]
MLHPRPRPTAARLIRTTRALAQLLDTICAPPYRTSRRSTTYRSWLPYILSSEHLIHDRPEHPSFLLPHPTHAPRLARARVPDVDRRETQPVRSITACHAGALWWPVGTTALCMTMSWEKSSACSSLHRNRAVLTGRYDDDGGELVFRRQFIAVALALVIPRHWNCCMHLDDDYPTCICHAPTLPTSQER